MIAIGVRRFFLLRLKTHIASSQELSSSSKTRLWREKNGHGQPDERANRMHAPTSRYTTSKTYYSRLNEMRAWLGCSSVAACTCVLRLRPRLKLKLRLTLRLRLRLKLGLRLRSRLRLRVTLTLRPGTRLYG